MDHGHAKRYACRLARQLAGDFFPGPVLMPHGMLHAMEPVLAVALGPARHGSEAFAAAVERMLRGRPDGPLLLALWASTVAGEIPHRDLREMVRLLPDRLQEQPATRGELLAYLRPRVSAVARCLLAVTERNSPAALAPAERLGLGLALTSMLALLPQELAAGRIGFPASDLERAGLELAELRQGIRSPAVHAFLVQEAAWARDLLNDGLDLRAHVGSRLRRGVRAVVIRSRRLLDQVEDPRRDLFRRPPHLSERQRWACAVRALIGIKRRTVTASDSAPNDSAAAPS